MRDRVAARRRFGRLRVGLHPEAVPRLVLTVQDEPRPRRVALHEPRLIEERRLHRPGVVGDGRLDERPHAPPADRARGDAADLDDDGRRLPSDELGDGTGLSAVARQVLEQVADALQPERLGRVLGLRPVQRQRRASTDGRG